MKRPSGGVDYPYSGRRRQEAGKRAETAQERCFKAADYEAFGVYCGKWDFWHQVSLRVSLLHFLIGLERDLYIFRNLRPKVENGL